MIICRLFTQYRYRYSYPVFLLIFLRNDFNFYIFFSKEWNILFTGVISCVLGFHFWCLGCDLYHFPIHVFLIAISADKVGVLFALKASIVHVL